jgi:hypothetical protein
MADTTAPASASLERPEDAGAGPAGEVKRWLLELDLADKAESKWRKAATEAMERYRDEKDRGNTVRFNILYSNVQTLAPALYNATPKADVRRRFRDADVVGKIAADVMERALDVSIASYDFDSSMQAAVLDYLLPGRAVTRVRYLPKFKAADPGMTPEPGLEGEAAEGAEQSEADAPDSEAAEYLDYEEVGCEPVQWDDFRRGPGKTWAEVPWIAFRHKLTREQCVDKFKASCPDVEKVDLDYTPDDPSGTDKKPELPDVFKRLTVWEIWDREARKVLFVAPSYKIAPLKTEDDPLRLRDFYPIPRPLYALESTDSLVPVEEYRTYKDQAKELDRITARINRIISGLKLRGIYDSTVSEFRQLFQADENDMIPSDGASAAMSMGGLDKAVWMLPVEQAAKVLVTLYQQREQIKQTIYEITGISDIIRGSTVASETATAQNIKTQWGTQRLQRRQREVQRYARDLLRLKAEIIGEHFAVESLARMSGVQLPTMAEKQQAMAALQMQMRQIQAQQAQQAARAAQMATAQQAQPQPGMVMQ